VSDLAQDFTTAFSQSKVVLCYGYNRFVSEEFHNALREYWKNGGKLFFISSYYPQYVVKQFGHQLTVEKNADGSLLTVSDKFIPFTHALGGNATEAEFVKTTEIASWPQSVPFFANGVELSGGGKQYVYIHQSGERDGKDFLTGIGQSERMIAVPSDEWLSSNNFQKPLVRQLTKHLLDDLLQND
jgi:hypothetical protein